MNPLLQNRSKFVLRTALLRMAVKLRRKMLLDEWEALLFVFSVTRADLSDNLDA